MELMDMVDNWLRESQFRGSETLGNWYNKNEKKLEIFVGIIVANK